MVVPTLRRRRLAAELRKLRETRNLTLDDAAAGVDLAKSTLSRIETAQITARPVVVRALLARYEVGGTEADRLLQLARDAGKRGWWRAYADVLSNQYADYIGLENEASAIRNFEPQFVPGLLQTEQYARAALTGVHRAASEQEVDRRVQVRLARQPRLRARPELCFSVIMDESVLRRPVGGDAVMADQLRRLLAAMRLPNVALQVLPTGVGAHPGMLGSFTVIEFPDERFGDAVYLEGVTGGRLVEAEDETRHCNQVYQELGGSALDQGDTAALIQDVLRAYTP